MSETGGEPEKYTIEEMMDRLKERDAEENEGKIVTRSDGSQALRTKKRRRRSNQAVNRETKRNERVHALQIAGFVIAMVVLGLAAGIGIIYANSTGYRDSLTGKLETASGAKVALNQFRMNPMAANAAAVEFKWPAGSMLKSAILRSVVAKIAPASFIGKSFRGEEIVAAQGNLEIGPARAGASAREIPAAIGRKPVKFDRYSVASIDVKFGSEGGAAVLKGAEISMFPTTAGDQAEIRVKDGTLTVPGWPEMTLDRSYLKIRDSDLDVQTMRFLIPEIPNKRAGERGSIDFTGVIRPQDSSTPTTLAVELESFRLPYMIGKDLGRFFLGSVDTLEITDSNFLVIGQQEPGDVRMEVSVTNNVDSRIDLGGFEFLGLLAATLDDRSYELPSFDDNVSMVIKRKGVNVEIHDINLVERGKMALRGNLKNGEGGGVSGTLTVGLPDTTISASENKRLEKLFGQVREGYRWLEIEIEGTSAVPKDNFRDLYTKAALAAEREVTEKPAVDSFENLLGE